MNTSTRTRGITATLIPDHALRAAIGAHLGLDADKIQPLSAEDYRRLSQRPAQGGLVKGYRVVPYLFGYETLPPWPQP